MSTTTKDAIASSLAFVVWAFHERVLPWPATNTLLLLIRHNQWLVYEAAAYTYSVLWFSTPFVAVWTVLIAIPEPKAKLLPLKPVGVVDPKLRDELYVDLADIRIPAKGLFGGVLCVGASGCGKTESLVKPSMRQIFGFASDIPEQKIGGLVLAVKPNFCGYAKDILAECGRADDYLEIGVGSPWLYNPLQTDLLPAEIGFAMGALIANAFGEGREPFWRQAYSDAITQIVKIYRLAFGYITFNDIYRALISEDLLESVMDKATERIKAGRYLLFDRKVYKPRAKTLKGYGAKWNPGLGKYMAPDCAALRNYVDKWKVPHQRKDLGGKCDPDEEAILDSFRLWFLADWIKLEPKLRMSITKACSVIIGLFEEPAVRRIFCPSREVYESGVNVLPGFSEMIEAGKVVCVNFPVGTNSLLLRFLGIMCKLDFQRAVLERTGKTRGRPVASIVDEAHFFASVGRGDPIGDDKFSALCREPECIQVWGVQSVSSMQSAIGDDWRTIFQLFSTTVVMRLNDVLSCDYFSSLYGSEDEWIVGHSVSETGQDSHHDPVTGQIEANKASVGTGKTYSLRREPRFDTRAFTELKNGEAICRWFDGMDPHGPQKVYLTEYSAVGKSA